MFQKNFIFGTVLALAAVSTLPLMANPDGDNDADDNAVYTMTNDANANSVMVYHRSSSGGMSPVGPVATGGKGTGAGLGSQGSLVLSNGNRWLLAVNAGSNDVSVFSVDDSGIKLASRTASGGTMPISVTISGRTVYVLNGGSPNNISGFHLGGDGKLTAIPNSTKALSTASAGPAQVMFSPDGGELVVTEKGTNLIDVFPIDRSGVAGNRVSTASHGLTPFGFDFGNNNQLFVSEAFGGQAGLSAASSYRVTGSNALQLISGSVPTTQTAACWLVVDRSGRYAYTTNTGSRTVSLFRIASNGALTLIPGLGQTPAGGAIDAAFSSDGRFLHVLTASASSIVTFQIQSNGSLTSVNTVSGPVTAVGLAAN